MQELSSIRHGRRAEVQQQFADGGVGDTAERRRNRERRKAQLAQLDAGLAPLVEQLGRLRGVDPPDYGSFDVRPRSALVLSRMSFVDPRKHAL